MHSLRDIHQQDYDFLNKIISGGLFGEFLYFLAHIKQQYFLIQNCGKPREIVEQPLLRKS